MDCVLDGVVVQFRFRRTLQYFNGSTKTAGSPETTTTTGAVREDEETLSATAATTNVPIEVVTAVQ